MKRLLVTCGIITLVCSGVIGITIKINVGSFSEAKDKVVDWYNEVVYPLYERGVNID